MTIAEYKQQFSDIYEQMRNEHGPVTRVVIYDNTKCYEMPIYADFKAIEVTIEF